MLAFKVWWNLRSYVPTGSHCIRPVATKIHNTAYTENKSNVMLSFPGWLWIQQSAASAAFLLPLALQMRTEFSGVGVITPPAIEVMD